MNVFITSTGESLIQQLVELGHETTQGLSLNRCYSTSTPSNSSTLLRASPIWVRVR